MKKILLIRAKSWKIDFHFFWPPGVVQLLKMILHLELTQELSMTMHCSGVSCSMEDQIMFAMKIAIMQLSLILIKLCFVHRLILIDFQSCLLLVFYIWSVCFYFCETSIFFLKLCVGWKKPSYMHSCSSSVQIIHYERLAGCFDRSAGVKCEWFAWPTFCVSRWSL